MTKEYFLLFLVILAGTMLSAHAQVSAQEDVDACLMSEEVYKDNAKEVAQFELVKLLRNFRGWAAIYEQHNTSRVAIVFRGTKQIGDWATNFQFKAVENPWGEGKIHAGFRDEVAALIPELQPHVKKYFAPLSKWKILITGHSRVRYLVVHV